MPTAALTVSGSSTTPILSSSDSSPAETYEIGYFASSSVPVTAAEWQSFTPIASISPKRIGYVDQTGNPSSQPGQFAFSSSLPDRASVSLLTAGDYPRRLGIRFYNADKSETNTVSATNADWLLQDPEILTSLPSDLNLADPDKSWRLGASSAFQIQVLPAVPPPVIVAITYENGTVQVMAEQLMSHRSYQLMRGTALLSFPDPIGEVFTGGQHKVFEDPSPPAGTAFYRITEL